MHLLLQSPRPRPRQSSVDWYTDTLKHPTCTVGWVARLCRTLCSTGKANQISHGKKSQWNNTVVKKKKKLNENMNFNHFGITNSCWTTTIFLFIIYRAGEGGGAGRRWRGLQGSLYFYTPFRFFFLHHNVPAVGYRGRRNERPICWKHRAPKVLSLKPGVGQCIAMCATLTTIDFFPVHFYHPGLFVCIFPEPLPSFSCVNCG